MCDVYFDVVVCLREYDEVLYTDEVEFIDWGGYYHYVTCSEDGLLGSDELDDTLEMTLSPNPTSDLLWVELPDWGIVESIELYSIGGQVLSSSSSSALSNIRQNGLDVSLLQSGLYLLSFQTTRGMTYRKFVKE